MNASESIQKFERNPAGPNLGFCRLAFFCLFLFGLAPRSHAQPTQPVYVINVLVLYTPQASAGAGGTNSILKQINTAVVEANTVFQNSHVNARIHLAHVAEINYLESGSVSNDLARLRDPGNGILAQAHKLRDQFNADLVCLVTETGNDWWLYGLQGPSRDNAFSIVRRPYLTGGYYFPVALSFNFGCQLERPYADSVSAFPYAYGYSFQAGDTYYSTAEAFSGQRIPYLSNPDILFQGVSIGVPAGLANAANNALVMNQTAPIVAAFRGSAATTFPPIVNITTPVEAEIFHSGTNIALSADATDPDGRVVRVDYYYGGTNLLASEATKPFTAVWHNVPTGQYLLFAVATDNAGATTISAPINIIVVPTNDNFAARSRITGTDSAIRTFNTFATAEPGEPDHAGYPATHSLWWTYTALADGVVTLDALAGSFQPSLAIYTGTELSALTEVTSASDFYESAVRFQVAAGQSYQLAVDAAYGDTGDVELDLHFAPLPANNNFANRQHLSGNQVKLFADNRGATTEFGETNQNDLQRIASLWWSWTAPANGEFIITLTNAAGTADANLSMEAYTGKVLTNLSPVSAQYQYPASYLVTVQKGVTYQIAVDSPDGPLQPGPFELDLNFLPEPLNDRFVSRTPIQGASIKLTNSIAEATFESGTPASNGGSLPTLWWSWTAPASGYVTIECPFGENIDVFTGSTLTNLSSVASGFGYFPISFGSTAGTTYAIAASGSGDSVELNLLLSTLRIVSPTNGATIYTGHDITLRASSTMYDGPLSQIQFFAFGSPIAPANRLADTSIWHNVPVGIYLLTVTGTDKSGQIHSSLPVYISVLNPPPSNDNFAHRTVIQGAWISLTNSDIGATSEPGEPNIAGTYWGNSIWWSWTAPVNGRVTISAPLSPPWTVLGVYTGNSVSNLTEVGSGYPVSFDASAGTTYNIAAAGPAGDVTLQLVLSNLRIVSPTNGSVFTTGSNIPLLAVVTATEQPVRQVEFFGNGVSLGIVTNSQYGLTWTNVPGGTNSLLAVATDTKGHPRSSLPVTIQVRPPNDDFANAISLMGETVHTTGSTAGATVEPGEPAQSIYYNEGGSTIWYSWTATTSGPYSIVASGGSVWIDMLEVYTGSELTNLTLIGKSNNYGAIVLTATAGVTYYIAIDNVAGFTLDIAPDAANDNLANAFALTGTNVTITGDSTGATVEPGEPNTYPYPVLWTPPYLSTPPSHSVWYTWTAPMHCLVTVNAVSANCTPSVNVFTGTNILSLTSIVSGSNQVSFIANAGTSYQFSIDGTGGMFVLNLSVIPPPGNDAFESPILLSGMNPVVHGNTLLATLQPGEPAIIGSGFSQWDLTSSVWYSWIAPTNGMVRVHCPNKPVAVYTGNSISNLTAVALANPTGFNDLVFPVTGGTMYDIAVAGGLFSGFSIGLPPPYIPDDFALSLVLSRVQIASPANGAVFSMPASFEIVAHTIDIDGSVVSVSFFDGGNLLGTVTNAPFQLNYTNVSVGSHLLSLQAVDQNGLVTTSELIDVRVKPINDDFAKRFVISSAPATFIVDNSGATTELGETLPGGATGRTLWWTWIAPSNGTVTITNSTFSANRATATPTPNARFIQPLTHFDAGSVQTKSVIISGPGWPYLPGPTNGPLVTVYTGLDLSNLTLCASNSAWFRELYEIDPFTGLRTEIGEWYVLPSVSFSVVGGQTYQLSFDGMNGGFGVTTVNFSVSPPPVPSPPPVNDNFTQATLLSGSSLTTNGTTVNATFESAELSFRLDPTARTVWYSWTAPVSGNVQLAVSTSSYPPNIAIYAGSSLWHLTSVANGYFNVPFYALAGTTYQISVVSPYGYLGTDFSLSLNGPPPPPAIDAAHTKRLPNGSYQVRVAGAKGQSFVVQASSDSRNWTTIRTDTLLGNYLDFVDSTAAGSGQRSYRVLPLDAVFNYQSFALHAPALQSNAGFSLHLAGMAGQPFRLQVTTNLLDWSDLTSGIMVKQAFDFTDQDAPKFNRRFYRALKQ